MGSVFQSLDVSDPSHPTELGELEQWADAAALAGDYAYLRSSDQFTVIDLRNPSGPEIVGQQWLPSGWGSTRGLAVQDGYAWVARGWNGLQILDVSVPAQPQRVGAYYAEVDVMGVAVRDGIVCLSGAGFGSDWQGLEVIDGRDLERLVPLARVALPSAHSVGFVGSYACVTGNGLRVFDLGNPSAPVDVGHSELGIAMKRLHIVGDLAYVAAGEYGLAIFRVTPQLRLNPPASQGHGLRLAWLGAPGLRLQRATRLLEPDWQDVPNSEGANGIWLPAGDARAFFRLLRP